MNLSNTQLFRGVEEKQIPALLKCLSAVRKDYKKGEVILMEGDIVESVGVVLSGMAVMSSTDVWGNNSILGHAMPGAVFAEAYACIPGEPLRISVTAAENSSVLFIPVRRVLTTCTNACPFHTKLVRNLMTVCAYKSLQLSERILHTSPKSIRGKLLSYFSECAKRNGSHAFEIPYSRQQLADYLGVDRSALCNELSKMQKDGWIIYHRNTVRLMKEPEI